MSAHEFLYFMGFAKNKRKENGAQILNHMLIFRNKNIVYMYLFFIPLSLSLSIHVQQHILEHVDMCEMNKNLLSALHFKYCRCCYFRDFFFFFLIYFSFLCELCKNMSSGSF